MITVITICYNEKERLDKTIRSVLAQTYQNKEYVIVDGGSDDGTDEIIARYQEYRNVRVVSGKDRGIYNAMNRGIALAKGDYINFMNAGDTFYDKNVLLKVAKAIKKTGRDLYYGAALFIPQGTKNPYLWECGSGKKGLMKVLRKGKMPNHQTIFAKKEILCEHYFNESYKIAADLDWFIKCIKEGKSIQKINVPLARVPLDGISNRIEYAEIMKREQYRILKTYFPCSYYWIRFIEFFKKYSWYVIPGHYL